VARPPARGWNLGIDTIDTSPGRSSLAIRAINVVNSARKRGE
jgi:hypothetical protein